MKLNIIHQFGLPLLWRGNEGEAAEQGYQDDVLIIKLNSFHQLGLPLLQERERG